jgi:hypothetical protein
MFNYSYDNENQLHLWNFEQCKIFTCEILHNEKITSWIFSQWKIFICEILNNEKFSIVKFFTYEQLLICSYIQLIMKISYICEKLHNEKFSFVKFYTMKKLHLWKTAQWKIFNCEKFHIWILVHMFICSIDNENQLHLWKTAQWKIYNCEKFHNEKFTIVNFFTNEHLLICSFVHMIMKISYTCEIFHIWTYVQLFIW